MGRGTETPDSENFEEPITLIEQLLYMLVIYSNIKVTTNYTNKLELWYVH